MRRRTGLVTVHRMIFQLVRKDTETRPPKLLGYLAAFFNKLGVVVCRA
jgi:hypothetical protein